jgi:hypothetical protein
MSLFGCRHQWQEVGRSFTHPDPSADLEGRGSSFIHILNIAMRGYTTIELRCTKCGRTEVDGHYGVLTK